MRSSLPRRWLAALLFAALPGLVLSGSERLRVCLHAWIGFGDACIAADSESASSCCAPAQDEPRVSTETPCDGCCVELVAQATERTAPAPERGAHPALALSLPPRIEAAFLMAAPFLSPTKPTWASPVAPPGRAPLPLRI